MASTQATNKKGAPTQQSANSFAAQMKASRVAPHSWQDYKKPQATDISNAGGDDWEAFKAMNSTRYPQRPLPLDDRDSDVAMIRDLSVLDQVPAHPGVLITPSRPYPVQEWELQYMRDKAANEDYAAYRQWLSNKYDLNDMATRAWFKQIAPEYFSEKRELLKELMDRHAKYSLLRLAGPENEEDLRFEYAVETGRIPIPKGPFYNPLEWNVNEMSRVPQNVAEFEEELVKLNQKAYQYGMFNPVKPRTAEQSGMSGNLLNPQDLVGAPQTRSYGFLGQNAPTNYNWNTQYNQPNLTGGRSGMAHTQYDLNRALNSAQGGTPSRYNNSGQATAPNQMYQATRQSYRNTPATYQFPNNRLWNWTEAPMVFLNPEGPPEGNPLPEQGQ